MTTKEQLEKEQAELKAKVDKIDVMLDEANAKYRAYDQKLQQEGLPELLEAKYEKERADAKENRDLLTKQRDPLLARISKLDDLLNPPRLAPALKTGVLTHITEETSQVPLYLFFMRQLKQEIENGDVERHLKRFKSAAPEVDSGNVEEALALVENLFGEKSARKVLYIREEVRIAVEEAMAWLKNPNKAGKVLLLGGGRGTGKTVIGLLVALRTATEGTLVLYTFKNTCTVLFSGRIQDQDLTFLNMELVKRGISPIQDNQSGVFQLDLSYPDGNSIYMALITYEHCIVIEDVGDTKKEPLTTSTNCRRMIVTSPNAEKLKDILRESGTAQTLIVPPWKWKDIQKLGGKQLEEKKIPDDVIRVRYDRMGGMPRWVNDAPIGAAEERQDRQISNLKPGTLQLLANAMSLDAIPNMADKAEGGMSLDTLFHLQPTTNWPNASDSIAVNVVLASKHVANELAVKYVEMEYFKMESFVATTKNVPALSHFRGYALEAAVHQAFKRGTVNMTIRRMEGSITVSTLDDTLPSSSRPAFHFPKTVRYTDVSVLEPGVYYQPTRSNEPTIDSFVIVDRTFVKDYLPEHPDVDNTSIKHFIVFFQITVAKEHHVANGTILRNYQTAARKSLGEPYVPMALVFVTSKDGLHKTQLVTRKEGKKRVPFQRQDWFPQFRAEVKDQLEMFFEMYASDKAMLDQEAVTADNARDVVENDI